MNDQIFLSKAEKYYMSINPFATLCQCHWETRSGGKPWSSELYLKANNAAGLKKWAGWTGETYAKVSWEQNPDGTKVNRTSLFCKYPTIDSFLANYARKIEDHYPVCVSRRDNFWGYFDGLFIGKFGSWATDHTYFTRLAETAVAVAPDIFGEGWQAKMMTSLDYAIDKRYLTEQHKAIALEIISGIFEPAEPPKRITEEPLKKQSKVICLDFGHGGRDPGAPIPGRKDMNEKDINLSYGQIIGAKLSGMGYDLMYTRVGDEYVKLSERGKMAQNHRPLPSVFLSIHGNSAVRKDARGIEIYTYFGQDAGDRLASKIIEAIQRALPGTKINADYTDGDVDKERDFAVLRDTPGIPSALIELGFLSNDEDRANLLNAGYRDRLAGAIADGINNFVGGA